MKKILPTVTPVLIGLVLGAGIMWFFTREPLPWLEFQSLEATYKTGSTDILLNGVYRINLECDHGSKPVIWRTEALATDGQIAIYGPKPAPPLLTVGEHRYYATLRLLESINPDGWESRVIASCAGAYPETVASPAAIVRIVN